MVNETINDTPKIAQEVNKTYETSDAFYDEILKEISETEKLIKESEELHNRVQNSLKTVDKVYKIFKIYNEELPRILNNTTKKYRSLE